MPRSPDPIREEAKRLFNRGLKLKEIAEQLGKPQGTIRRWKSTYKWDSERSIEKSERSVKKRTTKQSKIKEEVLQVLDNEELTDKQRLFCLYYIKYFNATKAYMKAYGVGRITAEAISYRLLENDGVKAEIMRLKQGKLNKAMLEPEDIFQKYMDIAFADVSDYVDFKTEEVPVMAMYGPVYEKDEETGEKVPVTKLVNTVRFKDSTEVDGTIISEVKQGKDGASIKLADRMKALQWLTDHMDLATEEQKARVAVMKAKVEEPESEGIADDGFLEALNGTAAEDWSDEDI